MFRFTIRDALTVLAGAVAVVGWYESTAIAEESPISLEWADLAFAVADTTPLDVQHLPESVRKLEGRRVHLRGYFYMGTTAKVVSSFVLLGEIKGRPMIVKFSPPDEWPIHQMAEVVMSQGRTAEFTLAPIALTGRLTFHVVTLDGKPVLVYRIIADSVERVDKRPGFGPCLSNGC